MSSSSRVDVLAALRLAGAWMAASAVGIYGSAMAPRLFAELMFGPICGHGSAGALHCPACYVAAALAGGAAFLIATPRTVF